jgi:hypothetical protein
MRFIALVKYFLPHVYKVVLRNIAHLLFMNNIFQLYIIIAE